MLLEPVFSEIRQTGRSNMSEPVLNHNTTCSETSYRIHKSVDGTNSFNEASSYTKKSCDVPPIEEPLSPHAFLKLQKRRLHNERIRTSLQDEKETCLVLQIEADRLRDKITKGEEIIASLSEKVQGMEKQYKDLEDLYRMNADRLKSLQSAVVGVKAQWTKDSDVFNSYAAQLQRLKSEWPVLAQELAEASEKCKDMSQELQNKLQQQKSLQLQMDKAAKENLRMKRNIRVSDCGTQTRCDFTVFGEIETIKKHLEHQTNTMKHVRSTIEVLRRCP
jgi:DNA repair exonuclease SbcCD ATPase subunit